VAEPTSRESVPRSAVPKHQLGIFFVHGIGEQPEGETLLGFGQPLITWLHQWLSRDDNPEARGSVEVVRTALTPSKLQEDVPPHAEVHVTLPNQGPKASWLMAESWWSGGVQPPAFRKVAGWMMTVGAWSLLSHLTKHIGRRRSRALRVLSQLLALVQWIVLASLLQFTILVLTAFTILPIPGARRALSNILLTLTGVLGDSYVLIESDLQRIAMLNKTKDALRWMATQCDSIIVIAHSQGAAIAHLALRSPEPRNVRTLLTFGSGLGKLEELLRLRDRPGRIRTVASLTPAFLLLVALLVRITLFEGWETQSKIAVVTLGVAILVASILALVRADEHWKSVETWVSELRLGKTRPDLEWIDLYATDDPVPNGKLSPLEAPVATVEYPVRNLGSVFGDHTSYWQNRVQFVPIVATAVADAAKLPIFDKPAYDALKQAASTHEKRVICLSFAFWSTLAALAFLCIRYWPTLQAPGAVVDKVFRQLGGPFELAVNALYLIVSAWSPSGTTLQIAGTQDSVLAALLFAALLLLWQPAYRAVWSVWDATALERVLRPEFLAHPADRMLVDVAALSVGFAPLAAVVGWPWLRGFSVSHAIAILAFVLLTVLWIAFVVNAAAKVTKLWRPLVAGNPSVREEGWHQIGAFLGLTAILIFLAASAFPSVQASVGAFA
jgi:hypothetical protein